ncbi:vanadium-dependent haloperoxidase [Flavisolibacter tropicus]|uniref:Phosphoesterase PA-phosphatase n=1 Tax=Flavisolibacter tropicus TaxID=1492898 RepID=A0A172TQ28_9BACT|nr:vanadium-dependent haloperoxidase [Flavisolibacter tropicus]ANE49179.1 phosphoesterase PA-phosphatase [Flavisolibacter tropicus]
MKYLILFAVIVMMNGACRHKGDYQPVFDNPGLYSKSVYELNSVVMDNNFSPVVAARNYVYANIAAYECIAAGDYRFVSLVGQIKHMPVMPKPAEPAKVNYHLAALLSLIKVGNAVTFPEGALMDYWQNLYDKADSAGMPADVLKQTVAFSDTIVSAILKWSKGDNYAQTRSAEKYTVTVEDGRWVPTPPAYAQAMEPHWCEIRPMSLDSASQFAPPAPPVFNVKSPTSHFYKDVMEVKTVGDSLTDEQRHIADFFDDNPFNLHVTGHAMYATKKFSPPGHWMNIVGIATQKAGKDFSTTVAAYAATSIALFDGFIACWYTKYKTNGVRPETVINKYFDPNWRPYIQTPPFPTYVSGHSVISNASAEVMTYFLGDHFAFTDTSESEFGIANRSFRSFRDAAQEASFSRLYGGIHYRSDLEQGNEVGKKVGAYVVSKLHFQRNQNQLSQNK